jgi:D-alanyl-D-alanine carboxypeptidase
MNYPARGTHRVVIIVAALLLSGCAGATLSPSPSPSPSACVSADPVACLAEAVEVVASEGSFAGALLIARDREAIFEGAYGVHPITGESIAVDTQFNIASSGKMFTAVAVAQLEQAGKLSFEDTVNVYLADLPADVGQATIGQLLSHTSGLGPRSTGLAYEPGTYHYTNVGFTLLAKVVEHVADQTFADYLQENVFAPAGMESTEPRSHEGASMEGAGGQMSTVEDMLRFANALLEYRLLDERATTFITSAKVTEDWGAYGYGFAIPAGAEGEPPSFGHIGGLDGVVSVVMMNPTLGYTTIVLCDQGYISIEPELAAFHAAIGMPHPSR